MYRFFVEEKYKEFMTVTGGDAHHIMNVLRLGRGDVIQIVADDGTVARGEITDINDHAVTVHCHEIVAESHEPTVNITLAQGLAKGEKMDFVIQKAVELGVKSVIPVLMEHSVVRLTEERALKRVERWQKIALAAAKQCKRECVPKIFPMQAFKNLFVTKDYDLILLAYEGELETSLKSVLREQKYSNILLIIGPEGGLSQEEIETATAKGARTISLGRRILRTETAGLAAVAGIMYEYEN